MPNLEEMTKDELYDWLDEIDDATDELEDEIDALQCDLGELAEKQQEIRDELGCRKATQEENPR